MLRAERHVNVSQLQAIKDCSSALECKDLLDGEDKGKILKMRADALNQLGRKKEADDDLKRARRFFHMTGPLA